MVRRLLAAQLLILAAVACGTSPDSVGSSSDLPEAATTTFGYDPPSEPVADKSVLPPFENPDRFDHGRTRIGAIEGFEVDEAKSWAADSGWSEVLVIDIDDPAVEPRPAVYDSGVLGLYERDGIVVEAWVGG